MRQASHVTTLRRLGYWRTATRQDLPDPTRWVDPGWADTDRELVARYYANGIVARVFLGNSTCRFCGACTGSAELSDGEYLWPQGLAHYLAEHSVRLPEEAERHALVRLTQLDDAPSMSHGGCAAPAHNCRYAGDP